MEHARKGRVIELNTVLPPTRASPKSQQLVALTKQMEAVKLVSDQHSRWGTIFVRGVC